MEEKSSQTPVPQTDFSVKKARRRSWLHFLACCVSMISIGWVDGSSGPLIPLMQQQFHVNYTLVSLIFIVNTVGCLTAAAINVFYSEELVLGKATVTAALAQIIANALQAAGIRLPFPVFVISYYICGIGVAMQDAQANGYMASVKRNGATKMGVMHAAYGVGALVAPLVSTQFSNHPSFWSLFYVVSTGLGIINLICLAVIFQFKGKEQCLIEEGEGIERSESSSTAAGQVHWRQIIGSRPVLLVAAFLLCYVGTEVTQGNWSVSYIINERDGGTASGYVSAGFFGGLTIGRVILLPLNSWIGEERVMYLYLVICIGFQLVVWLVPSLVTGALFVSFIGVLLGPFYPIAMNVCGRTLPPHILTGSIGLIGAFSASGGALVPFATGAIAQAAGIWSLQPLMVGMLALQGVIWILEVPKQPVQVKSSESRHPTRSSPTSSPALDPEKNIRE
ncbi:MFS general substrate transporter [Dendrothele bispora CBS 962.96]|uniref:MFS general substrate transporter n=1 Tax=Dendrothele bispora (strain CBS 962.96) TaxID=1314807 RepID=A0A4V4HER8_DENBC|nr:MFS general substrate transporter [Dendrothele bispora CBS 962.96]